MAVTTIPNATNWSVTPQNGQAGYFTLMNTWLGESTAVIASLQVAIDAQNAANSEINTLATQVENNATDAQNARDEVVSAIAILSGGAIDDITIATNKAYSNVKVNDLLDKREDKKGASIASATTTTIGTAGLGDYIHVTGINTITSFGTAANAGLRRTLIFDDALTITNGANLICVGGANIVTIANTIVSVVAETTTQWRVEYAIHPSISFAELGYLDGATSVIQTQLNAKAALDSPAFTNNPTAPTQTAGNNSTILATTAYVDGKMVLGTAVNSTSGTSIDFTGIPSWVKRITVMFNGVSTNGTSIELVQIGSGSIQTTGYAGAVSLLASSAVTSVSYPASGFQMYAGTGGVTVALNGKIELLNINGNTWVQSHSLGRSDNPSTTHGGGLVTLSGVLDRIRITTVNGTDTFDAGQINIMYEG